MHNQQYFELAELAGSFIHEIKNHLSTFGLHLQLLAEDFANPETPRERKALEQGALAEFLASQGIAAPASASGESASAPALAQLSRRRRAECWRFRSSLR